MDREERSIGPSWRPWPERREPETDFLGPDVESVLAEERGEHSVASDGGMREATVMDGACAAGGAPLFEDGRRAPCLKPYQECRPGAVEVRAGHVDSFGVHDPGKAAEDGEAVSSPYLGGRPGDVEPS